MKRTTTTLVLVASALLVAAPAFAQTGSYDWSISSSTADPFVNTGANLGAAGLGMFYLWYVAGCLSPPAPEGGGMSASEFRLIINGGTFIGFNTMNGYLNAGSGQDLLLAVGGCPTGPVAAGEILVLGSGTGETIGIGNTVGFLQQGGTVDCQPLPIFHPWPEETRFSGYQSATGPGTRQDHGNGCTVTPVEDTSWGHVKGLYR